MTSTKEWAAAHGICVDETVPPVNAADEVASRTADEIALRTIVLHAVAAVGYGVDSQAVVQWLQDQSFHDQCLWDYASPQEQAFLSADLSTVEAKIQARWRQEAQWTLLWTIQKVPAIGLPTKNCDTGRLVDEIMPALGESIDVFVGSAKLRSNGELLAEEDRIYNLHCYARQAMRDGQLPDDLMYGVLYQRHYAFEWLSGDEWDDVCLDT